MKFVKRQNQTPIPLHTGLFKVIHKNDAKKQICIKKSDGNYTNIAAKFNHIYVCS